MQQPHDFLLCFVDPLGNKITAGFRISFALVQADIIVIFRPEHWKNDSQLVAILNEHHNSHLLSPATYNKLRYSRAPYITRMTTTSFCAWFTK